MIRHAETADVERVLPLMLAYCDFYEVRHPEHGGLRQMARALIDAPDDEGFLLVAVPQPQAGPGGGAEEPAPDGVVGFAACGWKWSSLRGARIVVLEDLFVAPERRGEGIADELIRECAAIARRHGARALAWYTQPHNRRAQAVYDRVGGKPEPLIEYELDLGR